MMSDDAANDDGSSSVEIIEEEEVNKNNNNKRKIKVEEEEDQKPVKETPPKKAKLDYKNHPVHWSPEGNVLIQVSGTRFKLCRSRLAKQSWWFRALFQVQQTGVIEEDLWDIDKERIKSALDSLTIVDGCDLFILNCTEANDDDIAALFDAMEDAISYMNNLPPLPTLQKIYTAATNLGFSSYSEHIEKSLKKTFSDDPAKITPSSIPDAHVAVKLGGSSGYTELAPIARCAYYQIARRPIHNGLDPLDDDLSLLDFDQFELLSLLKVQRRLVVAWDAIEKIAEPKCTDTKCGKLSHRGQNPATPLRKNYLFDPIWAIHKLLKQDWIAKGFCKHHSDEAMISLRNERDKIWADMKPMVE